MYSDDERDFGIWSMNSSLPNDSFLCSANHNNPIMSFAGRQVAMGYGGWIHSHGLDYNKRHEETKFLIEHREQIKLFKELNYYYVILRLRDDDELDFEFPEPEPTSHWLTIIEFEDIYLYKMFDDIYF